MKKNKIIQDIYPLSPMQSGFLFQALYEAKSDQYFVQIILELYQKVNKEGLKTAWQYVSNHHHMLRTGFVWNDGEEPAQYVLDSVEIEFNEYDWYDVTPNQFKENFEEFLQLDRNKGFDLSKVPLFRLHLITLNQERHFFVWSHHHILIDGWSVPIILEDLFKAYDAIVHNNNNITLPVRFPYVNYIAWIDQQQTDHAENFWKQYTANLYLPKYTGFKNILLNNIPISYDEYNLSISPAHTERLKYLARENNLTLNTLIQGAIGLVLQSYTQWQEVVIGITVSGRNINVPGIEDMVGLFINTLPLRIFYKQGEDVFAFLNQLQSQAQLLNEYNYVPLAKIQAWAGFNKSLFDIHYVFENYPLKTENSSLESGLKIRSSRTITKTEYPLTIVLEPGKELTFSFSYQTNYFDQDKIRQLGEHIIKMLEAIEEIKANNSQEKYGVWQDIYSGNRLLFLNDQEKQKLLIDWNDTKVDFPDSGYETVIHLFEVQVKLAPDKVAITYGDKQFTYQELNYKINELAKHLIDIEKVEVGDLVALYLERDEHLLIAIMACLKIGAGYTPIDINADINRISCLIEETKTKLLITDSILKSNLDALNNCTIVKKILLLDKNVFQKTQFILKQESKSTIRAQSSDTAYVICTSGTTGTSKGIVVEHHALLNKIYYLINKHKIDSSYKIATKIPYTFDPFVREVFLAMCTGATLVILSNAASKDTCELVKNCMKEKIQLMIFVPSHLALFVSSLSKLTSRQLTMLDIKMLYCCGEILQKKIIYELKKYLPNVVIKNQYGPTEACLFSFEFDLKDYNPSNAIIPVGKIVNNMKCYLLSKSLTLLPIGVAGEVYIGGAGLARGYLNRPDLTAERFIANPFSNGENLRLYRTGDLARYLPDGNIEFIGRIDDQVKVRGFRIELGEIESALNASSNVQQGVVLAREEQEGNRYLVAYIVPALESNDSIEKVQLTGGKEEFCVLSGQSILLLIEEVRNSLSRSLPDYMIPSYFVCLDKIPLTHNGKIDKKALPAPDLSLRQVIDEYVPPTTKIEVELCKIWNEVLKIEKIGIHDSFFKLGGHSLLAIQLAAKINNMGHKKLTIMDIFKNPTIILQSELIQTTIKKTSSSHIFCVQAYEKMPPLFLIHPAGGISYYYTKLSKYIPNIPIYGINNPNFSEPSIILNTIEEIAEFYISLIKLIQENGPYFIGGWSYGGLIAYEIAKQLEFSKEEVKKIIMIDTSFPNTDIEVQSNVVNIDHYIKEPWYFITPGIKEKIKKSIEECILVGSKYKLQPYTGRVSFLRAQDGAGADNKHRENHEWNNMAHHIKIVEIPGKHHNLFDDKHIQSTAKAIKDAYFDV